ncbi:MAG: endonuclease domain-containing protein [Patescibacteria group bacterium]
MQKNDLPLRTELARKLRKKLTPEERKLWNKIKNRQLLEYKFRRQQPIGPYVLDFYCADKKLAIELDGGHHNDEETKEYDKERSEFIENQGIKVIRFWNQEVNKNINLVIDQIVKAGNLR